MPKLSAVEKEIIRRGPVGSAPLLAELFGDSLGYVQKIRNGSRGLPGQNGLGTRPWLLRSLGPLNKWRTDQLQRIEAAYQRGLESISRDEALSLTLDKPGLVLFRGALMLKPAAPPAPMQAKDKGILYDRRPPYRRTPY